MITKGRNTGRVGTIVSVEKHPGQLRHREEARQRESTSCDAAPNIFIVGKDETLKRLPKRARASS